MGRYSREFLACKSCKIISDPPFFFSQAYKKNYFCWNCVCIHHHCWSLALYVGGSSLFLLVFSTSHCQVTMKIKNVHCTWAIHPYNIFKKKRDIGTAAVVFIRFFSHFCVLSYQTMSLTTELKTKNETSEMQTGKTDNCELLPIVYLFMCNWSHELLHHIRYFRDLPSLFWLPLLCHSYPWIIIRSSHPLHLDNKDDNANSSNNINCAFTHFGLSCMCSTARSTHFSQQ